MRSTRQHAVFSGDPTTALTTHERRDLLFDRSVTKNPGFAETDQNRAFGITGKTTFNLDLTKLVRLTTIVAGRGR
jgi:hypothetical protein